MPEKETTVTVNDTEAEFKTIEEAKAELAKTRDALKAANSEAAERRKKLKTFEDEKTQRDAEETKRRDAELSEVERLKKEAESAKTALTAAEQRTQKLELRQAVAKGVKALKVEFQSDAAEDDANDKLLSVVKFEDGKLIGLDEALKTLAKERAYLFAKAAGGKIPSIDATERGKQDPEIVADEKKELEIRTRFGIR